MVCALMMIEGCAFIDYVLCIYVLHALLMSMHSTQLMLNTSRLSVDNIAIVQDTVSPAVDPTMELMTVVGPLIYWSSCCCTST